MFNQARRYVFSTLVLAFAIFSTGCGGSSNGMSGSSPNASAAPPGGSGTSSSPSPSPSPSPSAAPDNFQAEIFPLTGFSIEKVGSFTLNASANNGSGTVQIDAHSGAANSNYTIYFIPLIGPGTNRTTVGTFISDSTGGANTTFQFSLKGTFAGEFVIDLQGGGDYYAVGWNVAGSGVSFAAPLVTASTIYGGFGAPTGSGNAGSGRATVTGCDSEPSASCPTVQVSLTGGLSSHSYNVEDFGDQQHRATLGPLSTDAQGNGSASFGLKGIPFQGTSFVLTDSAGAEYISGFHVQ